MVFGRRMMRKAPGRWRDAAIGRAEAPAGSEGSGNSLDAVGTAAFLSSVGTTRPPGRPRCEPLVGAAASVPLGATMLAGPPPSAEGSQGVRGAALVSRPGGKGEPSSLHDAPDALRPE
jgi:hypothetical protein